MRLSHLNLLLVCTGNTCRSPMAGAIAEDLLKEQPAATVETAGVYAGPGSPASTEAVEIMARRGLDLRAHRSRPLTQGAVDAADMIFAMTQGHVDALIQAFPDAAEKTRRLDPDGDVSDPIGGSPADYEAAADQIESALKRQLQQIEEVPA